MEKKLTMMNGSVIIFKGHSDEKIAGITLDYLIIDKAENEGTPKISKETIRQLVRAGRIRRMK